MVNPGKIIRDPFIQFLILGGIIFVLFSTVAGDGQAYKSITVSNADVARLDAQWTKQYSKRPTEEQKMSIIDQFVREEILYREARKLDLGEDDIIIRRRMVQKYQFLSEDMLETGAPTMVELDQYFETNKKRYMMPKKTSFLHVYFKDDANANSLKGISAESLAGNSIFRLNSPGVDDMAWRSEGDAFMLQRQYAARDDKDIAESFGVTFPRGLSSIEPGVWAGPVKSVYGWHAVKVINRTDSQSQLLADIRETVLADYLADQRKSNNTAFYKKTRNSYKVVYENPAYERAAKGQQ
jgi:peptidyl-prolyl cis-trans isomerase C